MSRANERIWASMTTLSISRVLMSRSWREEPKAKGSGKGEGKSGKSEEKETKGYIGTGWSLQRVEGPLLLGTCCCCCCCCDFFLGVCTLARNCCFVFLIWDIQLELQIPDGDILQVRGVWWVVQTVPLGQNGSGRWESREAKVGENGENGQLVVEIPVDGLIWQAWDIMILWYTKIYMYMWLI